MFTTHNFYGTLKHMFIINSQTENNHYKCKISLYLPPIDMEAHSEFAAVIKWKYNVLLTGRIQIENHFNLLMSVCINARGNTAYVTNPLSDCAKTSVYVSACISHSLIHSKHHFIPLQVCKKKKKIKIHILHKSIYHTYNLVC